MFETHSVGLCLFVAWKRSLEELDRQPVELLRTLAHRLLSKNRFVAKNSVVTIIQVVRVFQSTS